MQKLKNKIIANHVGALSVRNTHDKSQIAPLKNHRGITLIALIITIIVMIILVAVTVNVALNGGLFKTAGDAAKETQIEADRETLQVAVAAAMVSESGITNQSLTDNLPDNWNVGETEPYTVTSPNENQFTVRADGGIEYKEPATGDLAKLQEYFVGKTYVDVIGDTGFIDNDIIPDASTSIAYKEALSYDETIDFIVQYNSKIYVATMGMDVKFKSVELIYEQTGIEGNSVLYSYDGTEENKKEWLILYDEGEYLEIVSPEVMGSLTLGAYDANAEGTTDTEKALNSYNNAITRINDYCASLITNENKESVRSLGSNPDNPYSENTTKYTSDSDMFKNYYTQYTIESGDFNYKSDYYRLIALDKIPLFSKVCWLASRREPEISYDGNISINILSNSVISRRRICW